ncbi:hypothetical protein IWQ62_005016 [Dispira parvispora]|uniref:Uncharacterized protein n=1 Tax=Dispira parvispora TaxID=1520584 RepID=A0A9W8ANM9_9FUNG|nr:hypothetical protein IWQ62_005016 [Dispira parvispora]
MWVSVRLITPVLLLLSLGYVSATGEGQPTLVERLAGINHDSLAIIHNYQRLIETIEKPSHKHPYQNSEDTTISEIPHKKAAATRGKRTKRPQKLSLPIVSKETYPRIVGQVTNAQELFELQRRLELPGKDFSQGNEFLSGKDFLDKINYVFRHYNAREGISLDVAPEKLSEAKRRMRSTLYDVGRDLHTFTEISRPPFVIPGVSRIARFNPKIAKFFTSQQAIVLAYCNENHPITTYYRLIWYPKDEKYTLTNLMVYVTRLYTRAHVIGLQPRENVAATMKFFQEVLKSRSAIICGEELSGDHKVDWLV